MKPARCFTPIRFTPAATLVILPSLPLLLELPGAPAEASRKSGSPLMFPTRGFWNSEKKLRTEHGKKYQDYVAKQKARRSGQLLLAHRWGFESSSQGCVSGKVTHHGLS
jgi:hypothetical protein